jgi:hypothetical protein
MEFRRDHPQNDAKLDTLFWVGGVVPKLICSNSLRFSRTYCLGPLSQNVNNISYLFLFCTSDASK